MRRQRGTVIGEAHAAAVGHEQRDAGVALELGELLRDRRGAVRERVGDGGERAAEREFVQQTQSSQFEHGASSASFSFIDEAERYRSHIIAFIES